MKSVQCEPEVPIARRKAPARVRYPGPHGAEYHTAAVEGVAKRAGHRVWFSWGSDPGGRARLVPLVILRRLGLSGSRGQPGCQPGAVSGCRYTGV